MLTKNKKWIGMLADKPFISKIMVFLGFCLLSMSLFTFIGFGIASLVFHLDLMNNPDLLSQYDQPRVVNALKVIQTFSAIGLFIIPSIISSLLFSSQPAAYLSFKKQPSFTSVLLVTLILFLCLPFINWLIVLNQKFSLPAIFSGIEQWMKNSEEQAAKLTEVFLSTSSPGGLAINLIMIALIPAIGEELLFRGVLQRLLCDALKNSHIAILISAAIFSALHMQFYGFIPRMLLGVMFGYFLKWSNTLWLPIIGHFINNATAVIFAFYAAKTDLPFNQDTIGTEPDDQVLLISTTIITILCMLLFYRLTKKENPKIVL